MPQPPVPQTELDRTIDAVVKYGNTREAALALGIPHSTLRSRLHIAERDSGRPVIRKPILIQHPGRFDLAIENGIVLVGSDAHIWPGDPTPAMRAFLWAIAHFKDRLRAVVLNGDVIDGACIGRWPSIGWEKKPTLLEELKATQRQLEDIIIYGGDGPAYIWTLGNHDSRFETKIANGLPEFQGVEGVHLKDHFPDWVPCWSCWVNDSLVIKHRFKGGTHATYNNTLQAGVSMATGHLHSLRITPFTDYNGTRWGVDTGTLATPYGDPFIHYTEGSPENWRAGFAVFSFVDGELMWPELVHVVGEHEAMFRGEMIRF